eukprot:TRINITY_DN5602_c0_g1_i2.p1 TRINITY_DN5602_c0_g1~~TRINITY_DN5602_c0_g1_i2.p1  ORF type:complete len:945 (+),score=153.63 TRINITY_DN5602_c0_g1_i2:93-2927(+)
MSAVERVALAAASAHGTLRPLPGDAVSHIARFLRSEEEQMLKWLQEVDILREGAEVELRADTITPAGWLVPRQAFGYVRHVVGRGKVLIRYTRPPPQGANSDAPQSPPGGAGRRKGRRPRLAPLGTECLLDEKELRWRGGGSHLIPLFRMGQEQGVTRLARAQRGGVRPKAGAAAAPAVLHDGREGPTALWDGERAWVGEALAPIVHGDLGAPLPVAPRLEYDSVTSALAAARAGDVVELAHGFHTVPRTLRVSRAITITAAPGARAVLEGRGAEPVVDLCGASAELRGITIIKRQEGASGCVLLVGASQGRAVCRGVTVEAPLRGCDAVRTSGGCLLSRCVFKSPAAGLRLAREGQRCEFGAIVQGCTIDGCGGCGVASDSPSATLLLEDCAVTGSQGSGVAVGSGARAELSRCTVQGSGCVGVIIDSGGHAVLRHCRIEGNAGGGVSSTGASSQLRMHNCFLQNNELRELTVADHAVAFAWENNFGGGAADFGGVWEKRGAGIFHGNHMRGYPVSAVLTQNGGGGYFYSNYIEGGPKGRSAGCRSWEKGQGVFAGNHFEGLTDEQAVVISRGMQVQVRWNGVGHAPSRRLTVDDFCQLVADRAVHTDSSFLQVLPAAALRAGIMGCRNESDWLRREAAACFLGVDAAVPSQPALNRRRSSAASATPGTPLGPESTGWSPSTPVIADAPAPSGLEFRSDATPPSGSGAESPVLGGSEAPLLGQHGEGQCPLCSATVSVQSEAGHLSGRHGLREGAACIVSHSLERITALCGAAARYLTCCRPGPQQLTGCRVVIAEPPDGTMYCHVRRTDGGEGEDGRRVQMVPVGALAVIGGEDRCCRCPAGAAAEASRLVRTKCCRNSLCRRHADAGSRCPYCAMRPPLRLLLPTAGEPPGTPQAASSSAVLGRRRSTPAVRPAPMRRVATVQRSSSLRTSSGMLAPAWKR